jgi:hypothetical protein
MNNINIRKLVSNTACNWIIVNYKTELVNANVFVLYSMILLSDARRQFWLSNLQCRIAHSGKFKHIEIHFLGHIFVTIIKYVSFLFIDVDKIRLPQWTIWFLVSSDKNIIIVHIFT